MSTCPGQAGQVWESQELNPQLIMTPELTLYYICPGRARQVWDQPDQRRRVLHRGGGGRGGQQARVGEDMLHQEPQRKCRHCKQRFRHVCL